MVLHIFVWGDWRVERKEGWIYIISLSFTTTARLFFYVHAILCLRTEDNWLTFRSFFRIREKRKIFRIARGRLMKISVGLSFFFSFVFILFYFSLDRLPSGTARLPARLAGRCEKIRTFWLTALQQQVAVFVVFECISSDYKGIKLIYSGFFLVVIVAAAIRNNFLPVGNFRPGGRIS